MSAKQARAALWAAIIARAEALHDAAVMSQRRPSPKVATRLGKMGDEIATLARAAQIVERGS